MGTIPTPPTYVAGAVLTAAGLNSLRDVLNFWAGPPQCSAYNSSATSCTNNAWTLIPLQSETFDIVQSGDTPSHDTATNNSRVYFRTPGKYEVSGQLSFVSNATGRRIAQVRLNSAGSEVGGTQALYTTQSALNGSQTAVPFPKFPIVASAGDYLEMFAFQDSGGALVTATGFSASFLWIRLIST